MTDATGEPDTERLSWMYRQMLRIREFEERVTAPPQTAWQAASSAGMVNSGNQPAITASAAVPAAGGTTSNPPSRSGSVSPGPPSTMTRRCPRRPSTTTALLAGVIIASSGRPKPISRMLATSRW